MSKPLPDLREVHGLIVIGKIAAPSAIICSMLHPPAGPGALLHHSGTTMQTYPVAVLAGFSTEHPDPLAVAMGRQRKALLEINGRPMVQWVVSALRRSPRVGRIAIVGVGPDDGIDFGPNVIYVPNMSRQFDNALAGVHALQEVEPDLDYMLVCSGDIPLLKPESVDWFVDAAEAKKVDFVYSIVRKEIMEGQFPGAARSYVWMREGQFCGGDLFLVRAMVASNNEDLVRKLIERRKSAFQQMRLAGFGTVIKFVLRRLTLPDAEAVATRLLGCQARTLDAPYADLGMDVDKPHQLEMVRRLLGAQA